MISLKKDKFDFEDNDFEDDDSEIQAIVKQSDWVETLKSIGKGIFYLYYYAFKFMFYMFAIIFIPFILFAKIFLPLSLDFLSFFSDD